MIHSNFIDCSTRLTYSIWVKVQRQQLTKEGYILSNNQSHGIQFKTLNPKGFAIIFSLAASKAWEAQFGDEIEKTKWNHFTFTLDNEKFLCVFTNGKDWFAKHPSSLNRSHHLEMLHLDWALRGQMEIQLLFILMISLSGRPFWMTI